MANANGGSKSSTSGKDNEDAQGPQAPDERVLGIVDHALRIQRPVADKYVDSLRRKHPEMSEEDLVGHVEKQFRRLLTVSGAGVGGAAALPGVGTVAAIALTSGEGAAFAEACAFLILAVARVRGVDMGDQASRKTVVLGVLGGEKGEQLVSKALGRQGLQWGAVLNGVAPDFVVSAVNNQIKRWIRRKIAARMGSVWAGRLIPFGVGAVIGGVGNRVIAGGIIKAEREIFSHVDELTAGAADASSAPNPKRVDASLDGDARSA
ncbi:hypothetical protein I8D64_04275 [Brachybacterium sp. MASK1Z-5]|uniref:EcsC protein family protein n=1 Tax=Brachybacterium halotolerans TaxID=2795215 RepID=A0ABS1B7I1_9MICO|nr:hypothetical protein [Brachybacterium halotolerans]MBK0330613.1 hypothetical protein [Brachybacterium halotolerans]